MEILLIFDDYYFNNLNGFGEFLIWFKLLIIGCKYFFKSFCYLDICNLVKLLLEFDKLLSFFFIGSK